MIQWTVLYAPGGRPLRDVNAKTKVTARAKIYSIPAGKIEMKITGITNLFKFIFSSRAAQKYPKVI